MIVDCAACVEGKRVSGILSLREVPHWFENPDVFVWLGLRMPDAQEMTLAAQTLCLRELDCDAAVAPHGTGVHDDRLATKPRPSATL